MDVKYRRLFVVTKLFLASLFIMPMPCHASLIYQIDPQQSIGSDSAAVSGYVIWDEILSTVTSWHIDAAPGIGVHSVPTVGAIFDNNVAGDTIVIAGPSKQTFYTTNTMNEPHEFEIKWDSSPAGALLVNQWTVKETWTNDIAGVHWRLGTISVSSVAAIPLPGAIPLFFSGLLGLIGFGARKRYSYKYSGSAQEL